MKWEEIKQDGSQHYKSGDVEPIDLYRAGGILQGYCVSSIIKYAFRNRNKPPVKVDMEKIKHLAEMMIALGEEAQAEQVNNTKPAQPDKYPSHKGDMPIASRKDTEQVGGVNDDLDKLDKFVALCEKESENTPIVSPSAEKRGELCFLKRDGGKCSTETGSKECLTYNYGQPCGQWCGEVSK